MFVNFQHRAFIIVVGDTTLPRGLGVVIPVEPTPCLLHTRTSVHVMDRFLEERCGQVTTVIAWPVAFVITALRVDKLPNGGP